jgi:hypothetical protein
LVVGAFLHRFKIGGLPGDQLIELENMANNYYDKVGKDTFRKYGSVTPDVIKQYQTFIKTGEKYVIC